MDLQATFDKHSDEYIKFERIAYPRHTRPDLCAFLLLHDLGGGNGRDMVSAAEHDEIWLDADPDVVAAKATEDDIVTLIRCGVRYDAENDSFCMFV